MKRAAALLLAGAWTLTAGDLRAGRSGNDASVKALVLEMGAERAAIAVTDSSEWDAAGVAAARQGIETSAGIRAANVILAVTRPGSAAKPPAAKVVEAVRAAAASLVPATLSAGSGRESSVSFYRRYLMKDGSIRSDPERGSAEIVQPAGEPDSEVLWLQVDAVQGGGTLAGLAAFALSGEIAQYQSVASRILGKILGPASQALVAVAPSANLSPVDARSKEMLVPRQIGTVLAAEALKASARAKPLTPARMRVLNDRLRLGENIEAEVQVIAIGEQFALVALPGDVYSELGVAIRRASPFPMTMVIGLSNASPGIVPTAKAFKEGSTGMVRIQAGGGEQLAQAALRLLALARREAAGKP